MSEIVLIGSLTAYADDAAPDDPDSTVAHHVPVRVQLGDIGLFVDLAIPGGNPGDSSQPGSVWVERKSESYKVYIYNRDSEEPQVQVMITDTGVVQVCDD